ncbi:probable solute symporter family transporter [Phialocephala subalpina]|uniref:Probable solute symporter family transporter n=1 Tax=Phialocephala subalpina TaxID=576137 RepID=A0A1L7XUY2_9HELO|nr:probable solute symporter family transporter [Phialocephala subalpina]
MASSDGIQVLSSGVGYGIVVGIGAFFALLMLAITYLQNRYTSYSTHQAEEFNTASRSVKPGLIAAGIVSSWTWSATLLTSSTFAYTYGISGPMWYGAMGTWQILLFALIAIKIKANTPGAHTFPEIVLSRHGTVAHLTYLFYGWATNMLVGACLVLGGSQVVGALSGVNVYAACFLIPLVVAAYVIAGGLRSTFIADYTHTAILFVSIFVFGFSIYSTNPAVGSPGKFYDLLIEANAKMPIADNHEGSYLTFKSNGGLVFAVDLFVAGFSTVWLDQAYWQRAIASRPETSVKAYIFGGLAWYGIPFGFATAMGLGCAALTTSPDFPTYPNPLSAAQNGAGLSSPATAIALLGKGGAGLMLLLLFMAVTSSTSAELIAVSSLLTFDVYKTYIKPTATSTELVKVSHYGIILYALVLAAFCCILNAASINLTWLLTVLGIIVGGASIPVGLVLLWGRMSTVAVLFSPWIGFFSGLIAWFVVTHLRSGAINVTNTGDATNAVAGNVTSWGMGFLMAVVLSFAFPGKFESHDEGHIARANKINGVSPSNGPSPQTSSPPNGSSSPTEEKDTISADPEKTATGTEPPSDPAPDIIIKTGNEIVDFLETSHIQPMDPAEVKKATHLAVGFNVLFLAVAILFVPFLLFGGEWVFSRGAFVGWCVVSFLWVWCSMIICVIWPVVESRRTIWRIMKGVVGDAGGKGTKA